MSYTRWLAASLGGGTGSGAAPVIANLAAQAGVLTISVLTLPRRGEGAKSSARAMAALEEIRNHSDAVLVVGAVSTVVVVVPSLAGARRLSVGRPESPSSEMAPAVVARALERRSRRPFTF